MTSGFSKLGYMTIRDAFSRNNINIERFTIKQASSLKIDLERLDIIKDTNSLASLDIVDFYPSISYKMIEKAVWYFGKNLMESEKVKVATGLNLLKTGMSHQILQFQGKYYEYKGANADDPGLTIGGFESAFSSDIVVAFLLETLHDKVFKKVLLKTKKRKQKAELHIY